MIEEFVRLVRAVEVNDAIAEKDQMFNPKGGISRYHSVGRSAYRLILTALIARTGYFGGDKAPTDILDFGAAYGRVTRFIKVGFPSARIFVSDLNKEAVNWCVEHLGVEVCPEDIGKNAYDLIFLGSVFTHCPPDVTSALLLQLTEALRPNGVLMFTTQGRYPYSDILGKADRPNYYGLGQGQLDELLDGYRRNGYGFSEYSEGRKYGVSLIDCNWVYKQIGHRSDLIQIMFQEKGYDNHQDCYAFMKCQLLDAARSGI